MAEPQKPVETADGHLPAQVVAKLEAIRKAAAY
jgi:hypothetical protein